MKDSVANHWHLEHMFIDIGADSREDAEEMGDYDPGLPAVPVCPFTPMANPKKINGESMG